MIHAVFTDPVFLNRQIVIIEKQYSQKIRNQEEQHGNTQFPSQRIPAQELDNILDDQPNRNLFLFHCQTYQGNSQKNHSDCGMSRHIGKHPPRNIGLQGNRKSNDGKGTNKRDQQANKTDNDPGIMIARQTKNSCCNTVQDETGGRAGGHPPWRQMSAANRIHHEDLINTGYISRPIFQ
ncbi:MAG: hypothetical protein HQL91_13025 [Magnetococcales bacterium]|nr:hypothetical protein [Magnetococcales bacterium]